jgi:transposase
MIRNDFLLVFGRVAKKVPCFNPEVYLLLGQKRKLGLVKRIKKQIDKFGLSS